MDKDKKTALLAGAGLVGLAAVGWGIYKLKHTTPKEEAGKAHLVGRIVDESGYPLGNVIVSLYSGNERMGSFTTGANGTYAFYNIPLGTYVVNFVKSGYLSNSFSISLTGIGTAVDDFVLYAETAEPVYGVVQGRVVNPSGHGLSGVNVTLNTDAEGNQYTTTNASGYYAFTDVTVNQYCLISFAKDGYINDSFEFQLGQGGATLGDMTLASETIPQETGIDFTMNFSNEYFMDLHNVNGVPIAETGSIRYLVGELHTYPYIRLAHPIVAEKPDGLIFNFTVRGNSTWLYPGSQFPGEMGLKFIAMFFRYGLTPPPSGIRFSTYLGIGENGVRVPFNGSANANSFYWSKNLLYYSPGLYDVLVDTSFGQFLILGAVNVTGNRPYAANYYLQTFAEIYAQQAKEDAIEQWLQTHPMPVYDPQNPGAFQQAMTAWSQAKVVVGQAAIEAAIIQFMASHTEEAAYEWYMSTH